MSGVRAFFFSSSASQRSRSSHLFLSLSLFPVILSASHSNPGLLESDLELLGWGGSSADVRRRPVGGALQGSGGVGVGVSRSHPTSSDARPVSRGLPRRELDLDLEPSRCSLLLRWNRGSGGGGHHGGSSGIPVCAAAAVAAVAESRSIAVVVASVITSSSAFSARRHRALARGEIGNQRASGASLPSALAHASSRCITLVFENSVQEREREIWRERERDFFQNKKMEHYSKKKTFAFNFSTPCPRP